MMKVANANVFDHVYVYQQYLHHLPGSVESSRFFSG